MRDPEFNDNFASVTNGDALISEPANRRNLWQVLSRVMEVILYLLIVVAVIKLFWPEVERQRDLQRGLEAKKLVLQKKEDQVAKLRQEHALLKNDREYLEAISRDRLNLQKEGEYIIRIHRD